MFYALKIKKDNCTYANLTEIESYLKTEFKSYEYMMGFLDGYLFDKYKVLALEKFERELNQTFNENYFIKFVKTIENEEE